MLEHIQARRTRQAGRLHLAELAGGSSLMLLLAAAPLPAQQIIGGSIAEIVDGADPMGSSAGTQASPWTINDNLIIGMNDGDDASLVIRNGGLVNNEVGVIGGNPGAIGTVTVTGTGSIWTNSELLYVGADGTGTLTIEDGAVVNNTDAHIAYFEGASGTVTVTGAGSVWNSSGLLEIDNGGTLTIEDGGVVNSMDGYIAFSNGSSGSVTVTGSGSIWNNSALLEVGDGGTGTLIISDGGTVNSVDGLIGDDAGAIGDVTVTGAGSLWAMSSFLSVGENGSGTLEVSDGGQVSNDDGYIGHASGSSGSATVTGDGSAWDNSGWLYVGDSGTGALAVDEGATVSALAVSVAFDLNADGTVVIAGSAADGRGVLQTGRVERGDGDAGVIFDGGILRATGDEADFLSGFNSGEVQIDAGGAFIDTNGFEIGISTDLQGDGGLAKLGVGTLTLSGANAYGGTTTVEAGTLLAGSAGAFVQNGAYTVDGGTLDLGGFDLTMSQLDGSGGDIAIGGASLTLDQTIDTTFAGTFSGTGDFFKNGSGTLLLTGNSAGFAGTTTISGGRLIVNGSLGGVVSMTGGTLAGSGTIGTLTIGAGVTVAPGNSIGTLTVGGDLSFDPAATYAVEAEPGGTASDLIHVNGTAFLNGASVVHTGFDGLYDPLSTYTILTADGGISGTFGSATSDYAFLGALLSYDANNVYLNIARNQVAFRDVALTANQTAAAEATEKLGAGHALYDAIVVLPDDPALIRAGFDALSGEMHASAKAALIVESGVIRDAANDRLRSAFGAVGRAAMPINAFWPGEPERVSPGCGSGLVSWSTAFGDWSEADADGNAAALSHHHGGLIAGADAMLGDWRLGLLAGYSRSRFDVDDRSSSGTSDNYHLGLYGGTQWGALAFRSGLAHAWHDVETRRSVAVGDFSDRLEAGYRAGTLQAFGEIGYRFDTTASAFEPFINLAHLRHGTDGFAEQGGAAALDAAGQSVSSSFTTLGLRAETPFSFGPANATLRGMAGWRHAFGDTIPQSSHALTGGAPFTIAGAALARNVFVLGAGYDLDLAGSASLRIAYEGQIEADARQHSARATLSVTF